MPLQNNSVARSALWNHAGKTRKSELWGDGSDWLTLAVLGILLVAARVGMMLATRFLADDAFITFRYAANLLTGNGFTYNPDEALLGTSAPLFALLLAGGGLIAGVEAIPTVALVLGCAADLATLVILWIILKPYAEAVRFVAVLFFSLFPKLVFVSVMGMETPLVVCGMALSLLYLRRGRTTALLLACSILLALRADTLLWSVLLIGTAIVQRQRFSLMGVTAGLVPLIIFAVLGFSIWGSPVPFSVSAKQTAWAHLFPAFDPLRIGLGLLPFHRLENAGMFLQLLVLALALSPLFIGAIALIRRGDSMLVVPLSALLYLFVFSFGRTVMADWYYQPVFFAYAIALAFCPMPAWMKSRLPSGSERLRASIRWGLSVGLCVLVAVGMMRWREDPGRWRQEELVRIGDWLAHNGRPGQSVMLEPIGYVGWKSQLFVHDIVGIVSPKVIDYRRHHPDSDHWFYAYVRDSLPTFVVLQKWELPENRLFLGHGGGIFSSESEREWFNAVYGRRYTDARDSVQNDYRFEVYARR